MPSTAATRRVHVGSPVRPLAPACVVGSEALPGFEVATVEGDAMDLENSGSGWSWVM